MRSDITSVFVAGVGVNFDPTLDVYPKCELSSIYLGESALTEAVVANMPYIMQVRISRPRSSGTI